MRGETCFGHPRPRFALWVSVDGGQFQRRMCRRSLERHRADVDGPIGQVLLFRTHREQPVFLFASTSRRLIRLFYPEYQPGAFDNEDGRKCAVCEVDGELPGGALDLVLRDEKTAGRSSGNI